MLQILDSKGSISYVQCDCGRKFWETTAWIERGKTKCCKACVKRKRLKKVVYKGKTLTIAEFWVTYVPKYCLPALRQKLKAGQTPEQIIKDYESHSRRVVQYQGKVYAARDFWRRFAASYCYNTVLRKLDEGQTPEQIVEANNLRYVEYRQCRYTTKEFRRRFAWWLEMNELEDLLRAGRTPNEIAETNRRLRG